MGHPALLHAYRLDGVVTLVDAVNGATTLDAHIEAVNQVAVADRLVLTKTDLVQDSSTIAELRTRLRELNPGAAIIDIADTSGDLVECGLYDPRPRRPMCVAGWARLLMTGTITASTIMTTTTGTTIIMPTTTVIMGTPTITAMTDVFVRSRCCMSARCHLVDRNVSRPAALTAWRPVCVRLKGMIEVADDPARPLVVHAVQSLLHPPARLPAWPDATRGTRLVLIGIDLPEDYVRRLFGAISGRPSVDTPDRAALADNPLAIAGFKG